MELHITLQERDELITIIRRYQTELRTEVHKTDNSRLKDELKEEQHLVSRLMERMSEMQEPSVLAG